MSWNIFSKKESNQKNYETLYIRMLELGYDKMEEGLSFDNLINQLKSEGFDTNNTCLYRAVMTWYVTSFHHLELEGHSTTDLEHGLGKHKSCNFILKGEACLTYIEYRNMIGSRDISESSRKWSVIAVWVAACGILVTLYLSIRSNTDKILEKIATQQTELLNIQTKILNSKTSQPLGDAKVKVVPMKKDTSKVNNKSNHKSSASH